MRKIDSKNKNITFTKIEPSIFAKSLALNIKLPKDLDYKKEIGNVILEKNSSIKF